MKIDLNKLLFLDIETSPFIGFNEEHECFPTWKNKLRKENLTTEQLIERYYAEAGLDPVYSSIVCISIGYILEGKLICKSFTGEEKDIINNTEAAINLFVANRGGVILTGWNIIDFDIPFTRKAASRYRPMLETPDFFKDFSSKVWDLEWVGIDKFGNQGKFLDLMKMFKGTAFRMSSMAEAALLLGLPSPKQDTDGSKVGEMFRNGEIAKIARYCEGDVLCSANILMKFMGNPIMESESKTKLDDGLALPEIPILKKLLNTGKLSKPEINLLKTNIKSMDKLAEEELERILTAIRQVLPDFEV